MRFAAAAGNNAGDALHRHCERKRSNPELHARLWIAASLSLLAMTAERNDRRNQISYQVKNRLPNGEPQAGVR